MLLWLSANTNRNLWLSTTKLKWFVVQQHLFAAIRAHWNPGRIWRPHAPPNPTNRIHGMRSVCPICQTDRVCYPDARKRFWILSSVPLAHAIAGLHHRRPTPIPQLDRYMLHNAQHPLHRKIKTKTDRAKIEINQRISFARVHMHMSPMAELNSIAISIGRSAQVIITKWHNYLRINVFNRL